MCFYETEYKQVSVGLIIDNQNELIIYGVNNRNFTLKFTGSMMYTPLDYKLIKTRNFLLAKRITLKQPFVIYSIANAESLMDQNEYKVFIVYNFSSFLSILQPEWLLLRTKKPIILMQYRANE